MLGQFKERLDDFRLRRLITKRRQQRMDARDSAGNGVAGGADFGNGSGTIHKGNGLMSDSRTGESVRIQVATVQNPIVPKSIFHPPCASSLPADRATSPST